MVLERKHRTHGDKDKDLKKSAQKKIEYAIVLSQSRLSLTCNKYLDVPGADKYQRSDKISMT